jgi:hypothetical protein
LFFQVRNSHIIYMLPGIYTYLHLFMAVTSHRPRRLWMPSLALDSLPSARRRPASSMHRRHHDKKAAPETCHAVYSCMHA